jgi:hypothetical protein
MLEKEEWRQVVGYEGLYEVSNLGRIRSIDRLVIFKTGASRVCKGKIKSTSLLEGYLSVGLWKDNVAERVLVHRLVLGAFRGPPPPGWECRHRDGNRLNAMLLNLEWGTPKQNGEDRVGHGTQARGEKHGVSKLSTEDVREIRQLIGTMTQRVIARRFGVGPDEISRINSGQRWAGVF